MQSIAAENRGKRFLRGNPLIFWLFSRMTITLENLFKFRGLIDTGAEINVMIKKIYASLPGLIMIENFEIAIIFYSNYYIPFLGICEDVKMIVGNIEYNVCIFVIDFQVNYALVLNVFFIGQSKLNLAIEEESEKQYATVISKNSINSVRFYTGLAEKRIEERVFTVRSLN
jgi:hypothetical protein